MFLLLHIIYLLDYIPMRGVRSGERRCVDVLGAGPSADTGFTARPWLSHLCAWKSLRGGGFSQENRFVSQGIGRKHMAMGEVEENSGLRIKCSFLTSVSLSGQGKGGERPWKNESLSVGGVAQTPEEKRDPRSPFLSLKTTLTLHFKVSPVPDFQSAPSPGATLRASP